MQNITESEFQREVEALKAHRRTSVNRPLLDPDLPETAAAHGGGRELLGSDDSGHGSSSSTSASRALRKGINLNDEGPLPRGPNQSKAAGAGRAPFTARRRGADAVAQRQLSASGRSNDGSSNSAAAAAASSSNDDTPLSRPLDPSHLFWVPASMHPEISPSDFRRFLHDHTSRAVKEQQEQEERALSLDTTSSSGSSGISSSSQTSPTSLGSITLSATPSSPLSPTSPVEALIGRSTSIARKGSILRRQYRPENDNDDETSPFAAIKGKPPMMQRAGSNRQYGGAPTLSIDDLQKLEQLAEEASKSSDPTELRSVLRRTMSLNMAPSALDQVDALPAESEQDAPLIVPRPGQILRRAARTKIRKASFSSEASKGDRSSRRRGGALSPPHRNYSDGAYEPMDKESDDGTSLPQQKRQSDNSDISEEDQSRTIFEGNSDGFTREPLSFVTEVNARNSVTSLTDSLASSTGEDTSISSINIKDPQTPTQQSVDATNYFDKDPTSMIKISPRKVLASGRDIPSSSKPLLDVVEEGASMDAIRPVHVQKVPPLPAFEKTRPAPQPPSSPPSSQESNKRPYMPGHNIVKADTMPTLPSASKDQRPAKEKKMGFGLSWFGLGKEEEDKSSKKEKKERKERERDIRDKEKETESSTANGPTSESPSFLGSLFGKKKGVDEPYRQDHSTSMYSHAGHLTAGSLLDARSKAGQAQANYYRYPIHVERAVYRLSHIKLANPRRPLYEQVLISNLMFWYLSIINRSQQQQQQQPPSQQQPTIQQQQSSSAPQSATQQQNQSKSVQNQTQNDAERPTTQTTQSSNVAGPRAYMPMNDSTKMGEDSKTRENEVANEEMLSNGGTGLDHPTVDSTSEPVHNSNSGSLSSSSKPPVPKQRRGGLVKPNRAPPGTRSNAETAIPAAAYGAQHRQIDSELANSSSGNLSNGYAGMVPSLTVGQIIQPRSMAAYSMGLGHGYEHQGSNGSGDEHAWLGSRDRRSPNSDDRRSDPLSDSSNLYRDPPLSAGNNKKMVSRVGETAVQPDEEGSNRRSNASLQRGSGDSSNMDTTLTSSTSNRSFASNTTVSSTDHGSLNSHDKIASLMDVGPDLPQLKSLAGSKDEANVLLEAARTSQSRRR